MSRATDAIELGFTNLRALCDPRGHNLLDALEALCLTDAVAADALVGAFTADNTQHSKHADLLEIEGAAV